GTVLDRIDYNVEQAALKINSALSSVQRAERSMQMFSFLFLFLLLFYADICPVPLPWNKLKKMGNCLIMSIRF
ncbi:unnamed protein product, partial [Acanthocheilonema viteae]